ncbi:GNAT family N-acetyltransferase [Paraburkholderia bannensis]|uniref:GNAT family N-acetyltransferase n=1 Tax=Paraburkholderia bannensis TaxID=765414 RepID=UPI00069365C9|nr:N-acetyltransferase [Paraburkholderia bannensis]
MMDTTGVEIAKHVAFDPDGMSLRAATAADRDFECAVFISTRVEEFTRTGWEPERIRSFLQEQFQLQHQYYQRHYPDGCFDIVEMNGVAIGRLYHAKREEPSGSELRVIDIALLPEWRGGGIGTRLLHAVLAEAWQERLAVSLYVERNNPVRALYDRLGFMKIGENGVYEMLRRPCAAPANEEKPLGILRTVV